MRVLEDRECTGREFDALCSVDTLRTDVRLLFLFVLASENGDLKSRGEEAREDAGESKSALKG